MPKDHQSTKRWFYTLITGLFLVIVGGSEGLLHAAGWLVVIAATACLCIDFYRSRSGRGSILISLGSTYFPAKKQPKKERVLPTYKGPLSGTFDWKNR